MAGKVVRNWLTNISQRFAPGKSPSNPATASNPDAEPHLNRPVATGVEEKTSAKVPNRQHFPDFTPHGYQVLQVLGHNYAGGRSTFLATHTASQQPTVIKQFQFAKPGADWSAYKAHEREIQVLQNLSHPGIPRYLDSFETAEGFCLVHEYKNARSLAIRSRFDPGKVKQIAIAVLEILVYLQNRIPAVIHRDIKPENILLDDRGNVYLIDFGFARIGGGEVVQSSVVSGTPGFMPPEQLLNLPLTEASDLYGLGATLICLLTQTPSRDLTTAIDSNYRINFAHLVPQASDEFIQWLQTMVEPNAKERFPDAASALEAIVPLNVTRTLPQVEFSKTRIELSGKSGEVLSDTITVKNVVPHTKLDAYWEIAPPSENSPASSDWIAIKPTKLKKNQVDCTVTIESSDLGQNSSYEGHILLHSNCATPTQIIPISVRVEAAEIQQADSGKIVRSNAVFPLQIVLVWVGGSLPLLAVYPEMAIAVAVPLVALAAQGFSEKVKDADIERFAEFSRRWLAAPSLAVLGIGLVSQLPIDWLDHPLRKVLAIALFGTGMGGIGIGLLDIFKATLKRAVVLLPLLIFGTSFVLVGITTGIPGQIAEVGVTAWICSRTAKSAIQRHNYGIGLALRKFGLTTAIGLGVGTGLAALLLHYGIVSLM